MKIFGMPAWALGVLMSMQFLLLSLIRFPIKLECGLRLTVTNSLAIGSLWALFARALCRMTLSIPALFSMLMILSPYVKATPLPVNVCLRTTPSVCRELW